MKVLLSKRVHIAWSLVVLAVCASVLVLWQVAANGPPSNAVLITSAGDTTISGGKTPQTNTASSTPYQRVGVGHSPPLSSPTADANPNGVYDGGIASVVTATQGLA